VIYTHSHYSSWQFYPVSRTLSSVIPPNPTTVSWPLYSSTCVTWHLQLRTGGFCWCKVLLPAGLTDGNQHIPVREKMPELSSTVLSILSLYLSSVIPHTHTHACLMALFPWLPRWAGTRNVNQSGFYWSKRYNSAVHPFWVDKWVVKLESNVCCRLQVAPSGESYGGNRSGSGIH